MAVHPRRLLQHVRRLVKPVADAACDASLLARFIRHRDEDAFAALVARHGPMVLGVCRRLGDAGAADDAYQATFLVLARKAPSIRPRDALAAWLYGVARRVALKAQSIARRQPQLRSDAVPDPRPDPLDQLSARELLAILDEEIQRLPQTYRLPILLCCLEGKTQEEAARQLGWGAGAVKGRLERGRARLRARLAKRGLTLSAALGAIEVTSGLVTAGSSTLLAAAAARAAVATAIGTSARLDGSPIASNVAALAEAVMKEMTMLNAKAWLTALCAVVAAAGAGLALAAGHGPDEPRGQQPPIVAQHAVGEEAEQDKPAPKGDVRTDRYGDPLPPGAVARLGTLRFRTPDEADALAFSPDGKMVAINSRGGLFLFDAVSGKGIKRLGDYTFNQNQQTSLAFSPDGKRLIARGRTSIDDGKGNPKTKNIVRVWELDGVQKPQVYDADHVFWVGWSADHQPLAVCLETEGALLRELTGGRSQRFPCKELRRPELSNFVLCACAPAGGTLVVADEQTVIHAWDIATGTEHSTIEPKKGEILRDLAVSPDGSRLATLHQNRAAPYGHIVPIWDSKTGQLLRTVASDQKNLSTLAFSIDGRTLATAGWNGIRCWDVATGKELSRSEGEGSNTLAIAFRADAKSFATLQRHTNAFHLWDVATGKRKPAPQGHAGRPFGSSFSPDGRRLASGGAIDGAIHIWDLATQESLLNIRRRGWVRGAVFSPDGRWIYSTSTDDELWISDTATGERKYVIKLEDPERPDTVQDAISMQLSADGKSLVAFSYYYPKKNGAGPNYNETLITGWDAMTRKQLFRRRLPTRDSWNAVSADARLLAFAFPGSDDLKKTAPGQGPMRLENLATGEALLGLPQLEGQTMPLEFSPDGRWLASSNYNNKRYKEGVPNSTSRNLVLWDLTTATEVLALPRDGQPRAAFSPNSRLLAIPAPGQSILVWDLVRGRELKRFKDFNAEVTSLAFAPDGRRLVSGLADSTLLVWDVGPWTTPPPGQHSAADLAKAWEELAGKDGPAAFRARWALVTERERAVALFEKHLKRVRPADPKRLRELLADLGSPQFAVRTAAQKGLEDLGELASAALQDALKKNPPLELSRRIESLLQRLRTLTAQPEVLQAVRAVSILEDIATAEARKLLASLAQGAPGTRLTGEAKAALRRLGK